MTVSEAVRIGAERLNTAGIEEAGFDARALMLHLQNRSLTDYLMHAEDLLTDPEIEAYSELIGKRAGRIPLQHLTGYADFYGYEFLVNPSVLIPRYDTEILVHTVLSENSDRDRKLRVLDLCTGSGCIAVTLKKEGGYSEVDASDISSEALETAKQNAKQFGADVRFFEGDLFSALQEDPRPLYDLIVCNPPYIAESERESLDPEVRDHDPEKALFAGPDGLDFYRRIASDAPDFLKPGGRIYLEIGSTQADAVSELLSQNGFTAVRIVRDLAGKDRVVRAEYRQEIAK